MPAGLLLSLTARTVRTGPGMEPSRRRCRRPQVPLPRWQERPAARLGKVSWELSPFPPRAVHCRDCGCALSAHTGPGRLPPASSPPRWLGQRHGHRTPYPAKIPLWLPSLAWGDTHPSLPPLTGVSLPASSCDLFLPVTASYSLLFSPARAFIASVRPSRSFQARRLCAQPAFFQPSRHLCAKKNDFVKKNANTGLFPSSLPDKSACSPPERPPKTGSENRKNQEITDFFRQSALTSPAKHVSVFSIAAGLQAVLGITCGVSVTFERVFFHVQVHLCWEPPLGRY